MSLVVDIIIPIYSGLEEIKSCLSSVSKSNTHLNQNVILIDDASPDERISTYVDRFARENDRITLLRNGQNKGFVSSVNLGMAQNKDRDVVLLNSDTVVGDFWLDRLSSCARSDREIGTATPFSNNATICSFPLSCHANDLPDGWSINSLDRLISQVNQGLTVEIPTGVGFCMYIKRACLDKIGLFDVDTFGRGYGEENDFCMRAEKAGWRHVLCADTFVYHVGGVSFGDKGNLQLESAMETLGRLYPDYHRSIQLHIQLDPARPYRARILVEMLQRSKKAKILFIKHNTGGGVKKHIEELSEFLSDRMAVLLIEPGENGRTFLRLGTDEDAECFDFFLPGDYSELVRILEHLDVSRIHYHHTMGAETSIWGLPKSLGIPYDITLHDYYFVNANPTLTDDTGKYCESTRTRDEDCRRAYEIPGGATADHWRENQKWFLESADRVLSPSQYTANLFREYFSLQNLVTAFHPDWEMDAPYPDVLCRKVAPEGPLKILVIGAISKEKGADVLETCAKHSKDRDERLSFSLLGYAYRPLDPLVEQHGPYEDSTLDERIKDIDPHIIWFPATWPETYSYTLSSALRSARPIVAPALGAFPERLTGRPFTWVEPWDRKGEDWVDFFLGCRDRLMAERQADNPPRSFEQPEKNLQSFLYHRDYLNLSPIARESKAQSIDLNWIARFLGKKAYDNNGNRQLAWKERLLLRIIKLRDKRFPGLLINCVPYRWQLRAKRYLSRRPIHEFLLSKSE